MKPKILFVDDDRVLTELAVKTLQDEYEIYTANNGIDALEFLRNLKFDIVVTDINMPIMSGEDLLTAIKGDYPDIEVIIITVYPTVTTAISTMKLGAYDYVIKPVDFKILSEKIRRSLEKRKLVLELETEKQLHNKVLTLFNDLQDLFISTIETLAEVIEQKDAYTSGHCERIRENSLRVGRNLGLNSFELRDLEYASLLHDIGKISIPERILMKEGKLTDEEFEIMKTHSTK
ncbi:MAG: response regulator, partial [Elusimicrobiota bacterium]|nr:response regulator [Elusimicrobiota bacterium]